MRFRHALVIAIILATVVSSCSKRGNRYIDQGEIHYSIDYIGNIASVPKEILPKSLILSFKHDRILFEMLSPFGNSGILNLSNPEKGIFDTYFSLFTIKLYYAAEPGEIYPGFEAMQGMKLTKTSKKSVICGFNCKNAEISFPNDSGKIFDIWYTNEINIRNSNASSPFQAIDGVLMSYIIFIGHSELRFNAETVYKKNIPDETFERRDKFVKVSRDDIRRFINKMISI